MEYRIEERTAGKTVLEVMKRELGISTAMLKHLKFSEGGIRVNDTHVTVRYVLQRGDVLSLATEDQTSAECIVPVNLPLSVVYEDEDVAVPDKPANMPTHPSHGHWEDTVANALAYRYEQQGIPFVFRPVNRLDRDTSGVLLIARNRIAAGTLYRAMQSGQIRKLYLAILAGELLDGDGIIEAYMRRTAESVIVREICDAQGGGDYSKTRYRVLARGAGHTLVCAAPLTGRTHQLRVHFAHLGCPILGDALYGTPSETLGRHALHSCFLEFPRVSDGETVWVRAPMSEELEALSLRLFGQGTPCEAELWHLAQELTERT